MESPVVRTSLGNVKGVAIPKANHKEAKQVYAYLGIPFAKPPLGKMRFKTPERSEPWQGVLDASKSPPMPMASNILMKPLMQYVPIPLLPNDDLEKMSEDCLYLNVYTNNPNNAANLPVLFWIYGGAFSIGSAIGYNGQALCGLNDVVLVVPQYRVNVFGFYSLGKESSCKGNMGLQDQILAMKWVKNDIRNFGGNPDNVTIFGESAGAISVSFHVLSPESRGLFHRAISHSGTATVAPMINADLSSQRMALHEKLQITANEPDEIIQQLTEINGKTIIDAISTDFHKTLFTPTVDGIVIPRHPKEMMKDGNFAPVPFILGVNSTEGSGILATEMPPTFAEGLDKETCVNVIKATLTSSMPPQKLDEVVAAILNNLLKEYDEGDLFKWSKIVESITTDSVFLVPTIAQAVAHSGAGYSTYLYYMTQQLVMHHNQEYSGKVKMKPSFCEADHSDDVAFTFGFPFMSCKFTIEDFRFTEDEKQLSEQWMNSLCRFAKTGNPNSGGGKDLQWPQYDCEKKRHLIMKMPYQEDSDLLASRCKLWVETIPAILEK